MDNERAKELLIKALKYINEVIGNDEFEMEYINQTHIGITEEEMEELEMEYV